MSKLIAFLFILASLVSTGSLTQASSLAGKRPNIIFIITDDQGYGDFSCHGNPILKTPNLDRLHREGARFTDFQVSPTCAPTRSALLTSRHEFRNGVTHTILERERLNPASVTLPSELRASGYATGIFGKWHLGDEEAYRPDKRGFQETFIHGAGGIGQSYPGSCGDAPGNKYQDPWVLQNGKFIKTKGYCTDVFFEAAIKWMEAKKTGKEPFYCHIATNAPHAPLQVRPEDEARYKDTAPSPELAKFFGMIANIDDNVGRLLEKLQAWGLENNTLVVYMNDNGGTLGTRVHAAGLRGNKGSPWQGGIRAASFWRWPGSLKPADISANCAHLDFAPTLLELAGAKPSEPWQKQAEGRSLLPLFENPTASWPERLLVTHVGRWPKGDDPNAFRDTSVSLRRGKWTAVSAAAGERRKQAKAEKNNDVPEPTWQLFDLSLDPEQKNNVAVEQAQVLTELRSAYAAWWDKTTPLMVNEKAVPTAENPFHTMFREQQAGK